MCGIPANESPELGFDRKAQYSRFFSIDIPPQMALEWQFDEINSKSFRFKRNILIGESSTVDIDDIGGKISYLRCWCIEEIILIMWW